MSEKFETVWTQNNYTNVTCRQNYVIVDMKLNLAKLCVSVVIIVYWRQEEYKCRQLSKLLVRNGHLHLASPRLTEPYITS